MLDYIEHFLLIVFKILLAIALFAFCCFLSIRVLVALDIQYFIKDDNVFKSVMILSAVFFLLIIYIVKYFFKKLQKQK